MDEASEPSREDNFERCRWARRAERAEKKNLIEKLYSTLVPELQQ